MHLFCPHLDWERFGHRGKLCCVWMSFNLINIWLIFQDNPLFTLFFNFYHFILMEFFNSSILFFVLHLERSFFFRLVLIQARLFELVPDAINLGSTFRIHFSRLRTESIGFPPNPSIIPKKRCSSETVMNFVLGDWRRTTFGTIFSA